MNDLLKVKEYKLIEEIKNIKLQEKSYNDFDIESCDGIVSIIDNVLYLLQNVLKYGLDMDVLFMIDKVKYEIYVGENIFVDIICEMKDVFLNFVLDKQF